MRSTVAEMRKTTQWAAVTDLHGLVKDSQKAVCSLSSWGAARTPTVKALPGAW